MKPPINQRKGLTLTELMISLGLFSILALVGTNLLLQSSRSTVSSQNRVGLGNDLTTFSNTLENLLTNTTRVLSCTCSSTLAGNSCTYPEASTMSTTISFLTWETETANNPTVLPQPGEGCLNYDAVNPIKTGVGTVAADPTTGYYLRGCKKRFRLDFTQPTPNTIAGTLKTIGTPGILSIRKLDQNSTDLGEYMRIEGVYGIRCGMSINPESQRPAYGDFHIDLQVKSRANNAKDNQAGADPESWDPSDGAPFSEGVHRTISSFVPFRNLNYRGVHFGLTEVLSNCSADWSPDIQNCCSGYSDTFSGCIPVNSCFTRGFWSAGRPNSCCSKMASLVLDYCE